MSPTEKDREEFKINMNERGKRWSLQKPNGYLVTFLLLLHCITAIFLCYDLVSMKIPDGLGHWSSTLQVLWKEWNFRSFVIASFTFQFILVIMAPFRKQTSNFLVIVSIWFSYLLADWVATQAIGLASKMLANIDNTVESNLTAFWAQFLLLHIGGPDTITALALEDNELWLRTALQLGVQVYATLGVLIRSMRRSSLWIPTILMFLAGVIKYMERAISLSKGRLSNFEEESDDSANLLKANEPNWEDKSNKELTNVEMVRNAFYFFHHYKGMYTGQIVNDDEALKFKAYLSHRTVDDIFRILEIELNLAYQVFYTKTVIIHKKIGKVLRPITILVEILCLIFWWLSEKDGFHRYDIRITYTLLVGAIAVDALAFFCIQLSDWNIPNLRKSSTVRSSLLNKFLSFGNRNWGTYKTKDEAPGSVRIKRAFFRRWSESILQFNLLSFCEDERSPKMQKAIELFGIKDVLDKNRYVSEKWFSDDLRNHIVAWLHPGTYVMRELVSKRRTLDRIGWGVWCNNYCASMGLEIETYRQVFKDNLEVSLIGWHVITEVCYRAEINGTSEAKKEDEDSSDLESEESQHDQDEEDHEEYRDLSKVISNYMMYLLVCHPDALPMSSGSNKRTYQGACVHVKDLIKSKSKILSIYIEDMEELRDIPELAFRIKTFKEVLRNSMKMEPRKIWKFMAGFWVLMLYYTAKHCKPSFYATRLREGGELLSFVWLFMAHYGMGQVFDEEPLWGDRSWPPIFPYRVACMRSY